MATKTIAWESGGGYITLTYTGVGNSPISVKSDANESFNDRQQTVRVATTSGSPSRAVDLLIRQKGKTYPVGTVFNFDYTGTVQEVTLPPGRYKLQCWGAQGGDSGSYSGTGSKGGYSEGEIILAETTAFYIFVGGKGASSGNGGWNGGGGSAGQSSYDSGNEYGRSYPACGGGATDIATVTSDMSYAGKRNNRSEASLLSRCIVAGGGAGGSARYTEETVTSETEVFGYSIEQGTWDETNGKKTPSSSTYNGIRIRSNTALRLSSGAQYVASCNSGYQFFLLFFPNFVTDEVDQLGNTVGTYYSWSGSRSFIPPYTRMSVVIKKTSGTVISPNDNHGFSLREVCTSTDTSSGSSNSSQQGGGASGRGISPGTQNDGGGEFGKGANQDTTNYRYASGAGGGGWYGGGSSRSDSSTSNINSSGGGSGFVNIAANAGYRPSGYTGLQLDSGNTIAGNTSFPSPGGGTETGHSGNGYARITVL